MTPFKVAIIGCGNISRAYAECINANPELELVGAADLDPQRAVDFCAQHGGVAYPTMEAALGDAEVQGIVNLTIHHAHPEVIRKCLHAGKHVHTEKPLAMTHPEAAELVELARSLGLVLTSSPFTFLGEAQQTAFRYIRQGHLGQLKVIYAEVNHARIETWHPNPAPFYEVGVMYDVGIYPITLMTALLGPVKSVRATGKVLLPERVTKEGVPYTITYPDFICAMLEFADGTMARLTANFYVSGQNSRQSGLEFHGDKGSLVLGQWYQFNTSVDASAFGEPLAPVPLVKDPYAGCDWSRGLMEMATAVRTGQPPRASGEHAAHVIEVISAINKSIQEDVTVPVTSDFPLPELMDWAV